jgi:hypothetical protein
MIYVKFQNRNAEWMTLLTGGGPDYGKLTTIGDVLSALTRTFNSPVKDSFSWWLYLTAYDPNRGEFILDNELPLKHLPYGRSPEDAFVVDYKPYARWINDMLKPPVKTGNLLNTARFLKKNVEIQTDISIDPNTYSTETTVRRRLERNC